MIEIAALAQVAQAAVPNTQPASAPSASAAARFAELMAQDGVPSARDGLAEAVAGAYPQRPATLGDQVLNSLQKVQDGFGEGIAKVGRMLEPGAAAPGVPELLRMQLAMAQLSVQVEVLGKAIGRSTQNIDQLVRMQ